MTSESPIVIGSHVRRNLGRGRQCAGHRSPGSTCSAGKPEKLCFTRLSEYQPGGADWIGEHADTELLWAQWHWHSCATLQKLFTQCWDQCSVIQYSTVRNTWSLEKKTHFLPL
jgi:hypothetical protein